MFDTFTWPIYLAHYLKIKVNNNEDDWQKFYTHCLERDYYTLSVGKKLTVLQILCDEALSTEELRKEMEMRVESEDGFSVDTSSENPASKDVEAEGLVESQAVREVGSSIHEDENGDECRVCGMDGLLVCCDGCPSAYHSRCLGMSKMFMPDDSWYCPECKINASEPKNIRGTMLRGGHTFGMDPYGQVFVASCDHLLVYVTTLLFIVFLLSFSIFKFFLSAVDV